jgi:hypothetical protein
LIQLIFCIELRCIVLFLIPSELAKIQKRHKQVSIEKQHTCNALPTPTAALEVILMLPSLDIDIEGEARQATYRLNCSWEFTRARFGYLEVFEKMTDEWLSFLAPRDKIVPIIAFGRRFLVELQPRSSWLSQQTSEILPSDGVIFYTNCSLCEGMAGVG